jgi:hypothetical protein
VKPAINLDVTEWKHAKLFLQELLTEGYTTRAAGDLRRCFSLASFDARLESLCVFIRRGQAVVNYKTTGNEFLFSHKITPNNAEEFLLKKCNIVKKNLQQTTGRASNVALSRQRPNTTAACFHNVSSCNKVIAACCLDAKITSGL